MQAQRRPAQTVARPAEPTNGHKPKRVIYPCSDGKPMAESPDHVAELMRSFLTLQDHFAADARVYVGADMFLYYEEGNRRAAVAPDLYVAKGVDKLRHRPSYYLWVEGVPPAFVLELTSPSTARADQRKREVYGRIGVPEYVLYDPRPAARQRRTRARQLLQGYRLSASGYEPIPLEADGSLVSRELGLRLADEDGRLRWYELTRGVALLDPEERAEAAQERELLAREQAEVARERAEAAETRVQTAQERAEAAEMRAEMAQERASATEGRLRSEAEARRAAEERAEVEAKARRAAEAHLAELEALLRQLRAADQ